LPPNTADPPHDRSRDGDLTNALLARVWPPPAKVSAVDFNVCMHDPRHAHASGLLAASVDAAIVSPPSQMPGQRRDREVVVGEGGCGWYETGSCDDQPPVQLDPQHGLDADGTDPRCAGLPRTGGCLSVG
jgi:hypothetical protein